MYILTACNNSSMLNTILFIKNIINIVFIIVPIILVLFFSIDIAKNVLSKDNQENQKNLKLGIKRIIYSVVLMFIPLLIKSFMSMINDYSKVANCYTIATEAKVKELKAKEDADYKKQQDLKKQKQDQTASEVENEKKQAEEAAKAAKKSAINNQKKQADSSSTIDGNFPNQYIQAKKIAEAAGGGKNCSDGHKTNCPLGDQTGNEVKFSKWRGGWDYIMRPDDPVKANKAAACMEAAVKNDNIGYGQQGFSHWYNLWELLKARKDWDPSTVTKKTSVSCCPLVAVCLKYAGYHPSKSLNCQSPASNMKNGVNNAGKFSVINSRNLTNIRRGDILINTHHMAMAV